ncbi:MAG: hypothetical protein ACRDTP_08100 [Mycobacteriales bacterium]
MNRAYVPPGWPEQVHPPGTDGFERTAVAWLFDHSPPDFRAYAVLRRHPVLLARLAGEQLAAAAEACRTGYRTARADLTRGGLVPVEAVEAVISAYEREGRRLAAAARSADLVARALRGESFTEPL